jgi:hypothetical protein
MPAADFVHEFTIANGVYRFAVADWVESAAEYQWPLDTETRRRTGCHTGFCGDVRACDRIYLTRRAAMSAARYWHVNYGRENGNNN